MNFATCSV